MPYISRERRIILEPSPAATLVRGAGELTFAFTEQIQGYIEGNGLSYQTLAEILGALRGAELDLERRIITPYEQMKQEDNGDVWSPAILDAAHGRI
jgi:hypothetical protein